MELTQRSQAIFLAFAKDAGNWSGCPWINGNVEIHTHEDRGNLADLVKKGLITIHHDHGDNGLPMSFIMFTETGKAYAKQNGVIVSD